MSNFNFDLGEDLPADLADAVRKSFSEPQNKTFPQIHGLTSILQSSRDSPIGTPIASTTNLTSMPNPDEILQTYGTVALNKDEILPGTSRNSNVQETPKQSDYQLFKHHYSISENARESVADILHELDIRSGDSISPQPSSLHSTNVVSNVCMQQQYPEGVISQQKMFQQQLRNPFSGKTDNNNNNNKNNVSKIDIDTNANITINDNKPGTTLNQMATRRSSIQEVQWVRQLLNPRSSFSGPSQNTLTVDDSFLQKYSTRTTGGPLPDRKEEVTKCWVTILKEDDSIGSIKSIIVLYHSLLLTNSKYPMYVLHDPDIDVSELRKYNVSTVSIPKQYFQNDPSSINPTLLADPTYQSLTKKKWFILSLFVSFIETNYELICYITPTSMVIDNIDELLEDQVINNEIDNETCVLLSNVTVSELEEPQLIIFKPSREVAMCIKEYFTMYGSDKESMYKVDKLLEMRDSEVMKELFGETWGKIASDGYVNVLESDDGSLDINNFIRRDGESIAKKSAKILDLKRVKPWDKEISEGNEYKKDTNNVVYIWYQMYGYSFGTRTITSSFI